MSRQALQRTELHIQRISGFLQEGKERVKQPGHEFDHSAPPSVGIKNKRSYTPTSNGVDTDNFTFFLQLHYWATIMVKVLCNILSSPLLTL
jgi:hypothetical protein